ncbi:hypothetical protein BT63DRAFT_450568 [Microthyrium microscopicum]|uniref:Uncharacterized protein n=1 Tax=Microthyrium microscopicum TaxID=703497 RepID=A0A6A6ULJ6_9PEZI|nr:hypothetical protein BT63DRAFT_450568 [Microthyrium microscopicum]
MNDGGSIPYRPVFSVVLLARRASAFRAAQSYHQLTSPHICPLATPSSLSNYFWSSERTHAHHPHQTRLPVAHCLLGVPVAGFAHAPFDCRVVDVFERRANGNTRMQRAPVNGQRSMGNGQWATVNGQPAIDINRRSPYGLEF